MELTPKPTRAVEVAVKVAGGQSKLARLVGVSQNAVFKWLRAGRPPAERVPAIVRATGGVVQAHELRPDLPELFPPPASTLPAESEAAV